MFTSWSHKKFPIAFLLASKFITDKYASVVSGSSKTFPIWREEITLKHQAGKKKCYQTTLC